MLALASDENVLHALPPSGTLLPYVCGLRPEQRPLFYCSDSVG